MEAAGATVYVTGRTVDAGSHPLPGTVGETAAEVERRGGRGIAVQVDHARDDQVEALFDQVAREQGRLDILVNNAFALPDDLTAPESFWDKPLSNWEMIDVGVRSNFVAAWHAARIMVPQGSGLIVAVSGYTGVAYTYGVVFGAVRGLIASSQVVTNLTSVTIAQTNGTELYKRVIYDPTVVNDDGSSGAMAYTVWAYPGSVDLRANAANSTAPNVFAFDLMEWAARR